MDRGTWRAIVHGAAESDTNERLSTPPPRKKLLLIFWCTFHLILFYAFCEYFWKDNITHDIYITGFFHQHYKHLSMLMCIAYVLVYL